MHALDRARSTKSRGDVSRGLHQPCDRLGRLAGLGRGRSSTRSGMPGGGGLRVDFDAAGPEGKLAPDGRAVVAFASNDYLGLTQHPDGDRGRARRDRPVGRRLGRSAPHRRFAAGALASSSDALADWKRSEAAVLFPTGFAANLGVLTTFGGPGHARLLRRAEPRVDHRRCRLGRAEVAVYPHARPRARSTRSLRASGRTTAARSSSPTRVFSMDGDVADARRARRRCAAHHERAARARRGARGPRSGARRRPTSDVLRVGTLSKTLGSLGGFVAGPARFTDLVVNRARSLHLHDRADARPTRPRRSRRLAIVRGPEGDDAARPAAGATSTELRPGHPSPIVPVVCGDEARAVAAADALLDRGLLVPAIRPPTVAAGTSRLRVALSAAHTPDQVDRLRARAATASGSRDDHVFVTRHRDRGRQDLVERRRSTSVAARAASRSSRASRRSRSSRRARAAPTPSCSAGAAASRPTSVCPPHRWYEVPMAPPMAADALGRPPFTIADLVAETLPRRVRRTARRPRRSSRARAGRGRRSPTTATTSTSRRALAPDVVRARRRRRARDDQRGAPRRPRRSPTAGRPLVVALNRYDADRRPPPREPRLARRAARVRHRHRPDRAGRPLATRSVVTARSPAQDSGPDGSAERRNPSCRRAASHETIRRGGPRRWDGTVADRDDGERVQTGDGARRASLDDVDKAIIEQLQEDGRLPYTKLGDGGRPLGGRGAPARAAPRRVRRHADRRGHRPAHARASAGGDDRAEASRATSAASPTRSRRSPRSTTSSSSRGSLRPADGGRLRGRRPPPRALNDKVRSIPGVRSTETFTYLRLYKQTYAWGTR